MVSFINNKKNYETKTKVVRRSKDQGPPEFETEYAPHAVNPVVPSPAKPCSLDVGKGV